ncbi:Dual specificity protein kinase clk2 [Trebouxia sp. C0010 RCD-2024]
MEQLIEDGTLQACALKRLRYTTAGQQAAAHRETAALSALCGVVHIAQLVFADCYREPITKEWSWALIMRFVPGNTMAAVFGELWRRIGQPKGASTIRHVTHRAFPQICQAAKAMHDRGMSHNDLKPGNIIISMAGADLMGLEATVVDLGGAILNNEWPEPDTGIHHTPDYSSPELLNKLTLNQTASNIDMCANDVWSLGCLLAEALTGNSLFGCSSDHKTPLAYPYRLNQARRSQMPWVESFYEGCPELCISDDAAVVNIPYTNHVYKCLAQTIPDHDQRRPVFELLRSMLHPKPQLRATIDHVLASSLHVFHSR